MCILTLTATVGPADVDVDDRQVRVGPGRNEAKLVPETGVEVQTDAIFRHRGGGQRRCRCCLLPPEGAAAPEVPSILLFLRIKKLKFNYQRGNFQELLVRTQEEFWECGFPTSLIAFLFVLAGGCGD